MVELKKPPLYPNLSQMNPFHIHTPLQITHRTFQEKELLENVEDHNMSAVREF